MIKSSTSLTTAHPHTHGAPHAQQYTDTKQLRYGHLMIMTDQDHDGSHIKGLIMNFFHHFYPSLLRMPGFLVEFITPIIKATRGAGQVRCARCFVRLLVSQSWSCVVFVCG